MRKKLVTCACCLGLIATRAEASSVHWSYKGDSGPEHWGSLCSEFGDVIGDAQSPIDIDPRTAVASGAMKASFHYLDGDFTIMNNGHTVQLTPAEGHTSHIVLDGERYNLLQLHFHTPSEHTLKGEPTEMEIHFVNGTPDGKIAVAGLLVRKGMESPQIAHAWSCAPKEPDSRPRPMDGTFNLSGMLPDKRDNIRYLGSLTTPPTKEGVSWIVLKELGEAGEGQIKWFTDLIGENARPVQPLNGRKLYLGDGE